MDPSIGSDGERTAQPDSAGLSIKRNLALLSAAVAANTCTLVAIHQPRPEERTMHPYLTVILGETRVARRHADLRTAR